MGAVFSQHVPSLISSEHSYPHEHVSRAVLEQYKGPEEDGDQKLWLEEQCLQTPGCTDMKNDYEACQQRIEGQEDKHCTYQYMNMWGCVDACAAQDLFKLLKHH